ncbi:MAG: hypothetical protein U0931_28815 [Vulcanimicrobiota bacterium]
MKRRGLSVSELMIALAIFSLLGLIGLELTLMAQKTFLRVSGHEDAELQLKRASRRLETDLLASNFGNVTVKDVPASLGGGGLDGSAVACLTAAVNGTGEVASTPAGSPYWQRNLLYYAAVPQGDTCAGGIGPDGHDDRCPHKVLMRKIIDVGGVTTVSFPATPEQELSDFSPYLTRPLKGDVSPMLGEPGISRADVVALNLLSFRVEKQPGPNYPEEVRVTMRCWDFLSKQKVALGSVSLANHINTVVFTFSVFPRNNR